MTEIIEKLEHGIMICLATGTMLVHIDKVDAEKVVSLLKEQEKRINELEEKLRLLEYGDQDTLQSAMMPAT